MNEGSLYDVIYTIHLRTGCGFRNTVFIGFLYFPFNSRHHRVMTLGGAVLVGRDVAVVEDDDRPAARRFFAARDREQRANLQTLGQIRDNVAGVVDAGSQHLLDDDLATGVGLLAHNVNHQRVRRCWGRCGRSGGGRRGCG